ncbi:MAG TPA: toll/interleukin-1 receptor domain-containing protein [Roseiarcus sp.]|nr:toll/interleukin-1 receptor domain-containing protein [Roseiarcus sp.]
MPALSDLPEIIGFFSYSRDDDRDSDGGLSQLRRRIQNELRGQLGRSETTLRLWQDAEAIPPGTLWESQISGAVQQACFFIPIISPRVINSKFCQIEFQRFLAREKELGRTDLVFPIIYIRVPQLKDEARWREHPVLSVIGVRQYVDWSDFRFDLANPQVGRAVADFCGNIIAALERDAPDPRAEEETARKRATREAERLAEERAAEDRRRRDAEAEETARAAEEKRRRELAEAALNLAKEKEAAENEAQRRAKLDQAPPPAPGLVTKPHLKARPAVAALILIQGLTWEIGLLNDPPDMSAVNLLILIAPGALIAYVAGSLFMLRSPWVITQTLVAAAAAFLATGWIVLMVMPDVLSRDIAPGKMLLVSSVFTGFAVSLVAGLWSFLALKSLRENEGAPAQG